MYEHKDSVLHVLTSAPIRLQNGRVVLRQCKSRLHVEQPNARNLQINKYPDLLKQTEEKLYKLRLLRISRGD